MSTRLELLKRYLQEDPSDNFLRYALAFEYMTMNKNEIAYEYIERLINDQPDYLAAYSLAGKLSEHFGNLSLAKTWYEKGIELAREQKNQHTLNELQESLNLLS